MQHHPFLAKPAYNFKTCPSPKEKRDGMSIDCGEETLNFLGGEIFVSHDMFR